jgi:hypothetical protein
MPKIKCLELAGQECSTSEGIIQFDAAGIGVIESEELHASLLKQRAFQPVEEPVKSELKPAPKSPKPPQPAVVEEVKEIVALEPTKE